MKPLTNRFLNLRKHVVCYFLLTLLLIPFQGTSHGTMTYPPSRVYSCFLEGPENPISSACIDAVASHGTQPLYDWNEINQANANGNHTAYVFDGNLPSGGRPNKYGGMDQIRNDWVATLVSPGPFTVTWTNTAPHATAYYEVYITKADWTPDQVLTWDSLELLVRTDPSGPESIVDIPLTLPVREGKHVLYSIWQRSDSPEAFYATSDIEFDNTLSDQNSHDIITSLSVFPNPVDETTSISYKLSEPSYVSLVIYDVVGNEVFTLVDSYQSQLENQVYLNNDNKLSEGVYFGVLKVNDSIKTFKLIFD